MVHSFRKRGILMQAGLMIAVAVFGFTIINGVTSAAQATATLTPTPMGGGHGQIAFQAIRDGYWEIDLINADGTNLRRLTNGLSGDEQPAWSPDGNRITFTKTVDDGQTEIYMMNADGSNPHRLINDTASDYEAKWSPDGKQIVFASSLDNDFNYQIYLI